MKVLVVSPHPDDEVLGAGGTLLKLNAEGHDLYWLNFTNMKKEYGFEETVIEKRKNEIECIKKYMNFKKMYDLGLKPAGLNQYEESKLIEQVKRILEEIAPELIIIPYKHDVHTDHKKVFDILYSSTKAFRMPFIKRVWSMEILSETDQAVCFEGFLPNVYVNIDKYIEQKCEVARIYKSEIKDSPFPRNVNAIRGLAAVRGAASSYAYAEGFLCLREMWD